MTFALMRARSWLLVGTAAVVLSVPRPGVAQENAKKDEASGTPAASAPAILSKLKEAFPASRIDSVTATPIAGVYEVVAGANVFYSDAQARYMMFGKLFDMSSRTDLTAARLADVQRVDVNALPHAYALKLVRGTGKRVLYVFADPNCGYCKALEKTLEEVDDLTTYVYLVPLLGPDSFDKARAIWCAADRTAAWREWMLRGKAPGAAREPCEDPLDLNLELAKRLGLPGTPMSIAADGRRLMGAVAKADIEALFKSSPAAVVASTLPAPSKP